MWHPHIFYSLNLKNKQNIKIQANAIVYNKAWDKIEIRPFRMANIKKRAQNPLIK